MKASPQIKTAETTSDKILALARKHQVDHYENNVVENIETITLHYNRWEQGILLYNDLTDLMGRGGGRVRQNVKLMTITVRLQNDK